VLTKLLIKEKDTEDLFQLVYSQALVIYKNDKSLSIEIKDPQSKTIIHQYTFLNNEIPLAR
jgi:hypothetical protein